MLKNARRGVTIVSGEGKQVREFCENAGLTVEKIEKQKKFRLHLVAGK